MGRGNIIQAQNEFDGYPQPKSVAAAGAAPIVYAGLAETYVLTLTAATTVGVPAQSTTCPPGTTLCLIFVQDATAGRTLAFNAIFRNAPSISGGAATAGQRCSTEWRWDGVSWQYTGGSTAFA